MKYIFNHMLRVLLFLYLIIRVNPATEIFRAVHDYTQNMTSFLYNNIQSLL